MQFKELYTARGFQASSEPLIHFGYGTHKKIDSLRIVWPDRSYQLMTQVSTNQTLTISPENTQPFDYRSIQPSRIDIFKKVDGNLGLLFTHQEDRYTDFNRQKLIPYQISDRGPAAAIGDLNGDGRADIFLGGSKYSPSEIYLQGDTVYHKTSLPEIEKDSIKEDVAAAIADFNADGKNDLFIGSGGADFFNQMKPLLDSYYVNSDSHFESRPLPDYFENASTIKPYDFDDDGDVDVFVGNQAVSNDFGNIPKSYLLENENGNFKLTENKALTNAGMITDAVWTDFDNDNDADLILIGEWMSPKFLKNENSTLSEIALLDNAINGLWQSIAPFDIDHDGDLDYVLGNWGTNSKFKASESSPMKMYYGDFDTNGSTETVVATKKNGTYYPLEDLDGLAAQMVSLRKKFTTYIDFAGKPIEEIFEKAVLNQAKIHEVHELRSGYLENTNGRFIFIPFQVELQVAPIMALLTYDFDGDNSAELLAAGNYFGLKPLHGRLGAFAGAMIKDKNTVVLGNVIGLDFINKSARKLNVISLNKRPYLLATFNNEKAQVYKLIKKSTE